MINDGQEKQISVVQRGEIEQPLVARVVIKATDENVAGLGEQFPVQVESGRPRGTLSSSFEGLDVRDILRGDPFFLEHSFDMKELKNQINKK